MSTDAKRTKKGIERYFLERARQLDPRIPAGEIVECESPDFLIATSCGTLGIEVTQIFQPAASGGFNPRQVESFQDKVIRVAARLYEQSGARPVDVLVYREGKGARHSHSRVAKSLVDFVRSRYGDSENYTRIYQRPHTPQGFLAIRVARPVDGATNTWQAGHAGRNLRLSQTLLSAEIERKNKLVPTYRQKADPIWLLLVASLFPLSASFSIPDEIETWSFSFDFDKVLLLSEEDARVFKLRGP
jgi:hypothetical protein